MSYPQSDRSQSPPTESFFVQALYDYSGVDTSSLSFSAGDVIEVLSTLESGWWDGILCDAKIRGWFPSNYVAAISVEHAIQESEASHDGWNGANGGGAAAQHDQFTAGAIATDATLDPMAALDQFMRDHDINAHDDGADIFGQIVAETTAEDNGSAQAHKRLSRLAAQQNARILRQEQEEEDGRDPDEFWVPKMTFDGQLFYFNTRTSETSRDMPIDGRGDGVQIDPSTFLSEDENETFHDARTRPVSLPPALVLPTEPGRQPPQRAATADNGLLSAFNERPAQPRNGDAELNRLSFYSDDSGVDNEFGGARRNKGKQAEGAQEKRKSKAGQRRKPSTAQLLEPAAPPLLSELETLVVAALQSLVNGVGVGPLATRQPSEQPPISEDEERDRLSQLSDEVVAAVRTLLHATGVLEQQPTTLSANAHALLRPHTRRLNSTLSKLVLSVRAVWGLLATSAADQVLEADDPTIAGESGPKKEMIRAQVMQQFADVREHRIETETKLRADTMNCARDVQDNAASFLDEYARVIGAESAKSGGPPLPRSMLRAPKTLQGSLKTNAAALLLPGGGYGGNWRGNGFVTLPTEDEGGYTYPAKPISQEVSAALNAESLVLLEEADKLKAMVKALSAGPPVPEKSGGRPQSAISVSGSSRPSTPASRLSLRPSSSSLRSADVSPPKLLEQAAQLQRKIASFLCEAEDIDVAAGVDFELPLDEASRANSPKPDVGPSTTISSPINVDEPEAAADSAAEYRQSVLEAKPLLAELEVRKQALYDVAPALLVALQELHMARAHNSESSTFGGAQPFGNSPFAQYSPAHRGEDGTSSTILDILANLKTSVNTLCTTIASLAAIAQVQAAAPSNLRGASLAFRSSLFEIPTSPSISSVASRVNGKSALGNEIFSSPTSSRQSRDGDDDRRRESVDSDFFFSTGSAPTPINTVGLNKKTSAAHLYDGEFRRGSIANSVTTNASSVGSVWSPGGTPRSKSAKLAKILGADSPTTPSRSMSFAEDLPIWLGPDYGPDEISFNMEGQVKGGTLRALVIAAASHEGRVDSNYLSAFLMTYRTFCTGHELLDVLEERYLIEPPEEARETEENMRLWETRKQKPIRARVANVLKSWVREHMEHDELDPQVLHRIADFAARTMRDPVQSPQIIKAVEERLKTKPAQARTTNNLAPGPPPSSFVPRSLRKLKFTDIDALELARQLALRDGKLFGKITPQECLGKAWPKQFGSEAPNISSMIDMSNAVTRWVTETILLQEDVKKRANIIKQFVLVAERSLSLNNFSTLIHIVAGLNSTPIHRLRRTWEQVSQKTLMVLGMLNNVMKPDKNYKEYREALRGVAPPCVPFLGVYLTDWTFIGDGNPDMLREKPHQINFNKRQKASELILMIKLHQSTSYNLAAVPVISKFIEEQLKPTGANAAADDQRLYELSLQREPRENEDAKIARLLSESGFL